MKDSGIEWIGEIPEEWKVEPIKFHLQRNDVKNHPDEKILSVYRDYGVIPKDSRTDNHNVTSQDTSKYKLVMPGELVINKMKAWQGSLAVSKYQGIVSPAYYIYKFINNRLNRNYLNYLIRVCYKDEFRRISGGIREGQWDLSAYDFEHIPILVPSLNEQSCIVSFLNKKIDKINQTSQTIQQEIDALEEYRKSLITETVTKGLDKTVPMKDSGIEWIGEIPENWKVEKLKFLGTVRNGLTYSPEDLSDDGTLVLRSSNIKKGKVYDADNVYVNMFVPQNLILKENDLLICSRNGSAKLIGKNALINEKYAGSSFGAFMAVFRSKYNEYIHYVLNSNIFDYYIGSFLTSTINQLTNRNLLNLSIPFPASKTERQQIISFLKKKCSMIDFIIDKKKEQISCLTQYKQSIVYEYVTGKKQVSEKEGVKNAQ